jgi:hypothetical protein
MSVRRWARDPADPSDPERGDPIDGMPRLSCVTASKVCRSTLLILSGAQALAWRAA